MTRTRREGGHRGRLPVFRAIGLVAALIVLAPTGLASVQVSRPAQEQFADGSTPLQWAVYRGDLDEARRLIEEGADVSATNLYGATAMQLAAEVADVEMIRLLLRAGADPESANAEGQTALMAVARTGNVEAARLLIQKGAHVNAREQWGGQTALMWAAARSQPEMVKFLISKGAEVDARSAVRDFPRHVTAEGRPKDMVTGGLTPLLYAAREGCIDCAKHLIKGGAKIDLADPEGVTPLMIAMMNFNWELAKFLVLAGANVNTWDIFGQSPLFVALDHRALPPGTRGLAGRVSEIGGLDLMRMLLERGANPNMQLAFRPAHRTGSGMVQVISRGTTPLLRAAVAADIEAMKLLIEYGADVDLGNADGTTPMMAVFIPSRLRAPVKTEEQALEVLRVLHAAGADVNRMAIPHHLQRTRGGTVLHLATRLGWKRAMAEVVSYGVDVNARDKDGLTALDYALSRGYVDFLQQKPPVREDLAAMLRGWGATVEDPAPREWPPVPAPLYFKHIVPPL